MSKTCQGLNEIIIDRLCIRCLASFEQFSMLELPECGQVAEVVKSRAAFLTILKKVGNERKVA